MNLLVAIKSCNKYVDRRSAVKHTWLPALDWADHVFIVGQPTPKVVDEHILACEVSDAFDSIAPKIQAVCQYALQQNVRNMFVCDDDTYVRPERLFMSDFERHDYVGFVRPNGIPYMQGSAYWLSARAMEIVVKSSWMRPGIIDDGAVGAALVDKVAFVHDHRYPPGPRPDLRPVPNKNNIISCHKCLPRDMHEIHQNWQLQGGK